MINESLNSRNNKNRLTSKLVITPSVPFWADGNMALFDRKFYDGMLEYIRLWPGEVSCIMEQSKSMLPKFGIIKKTISELPFELVMLLENELVKPKHIMNATIVLAAADSFKQLHLSKICKFNNIKCVYIIEYTLKTRLQILEIEPTNFAVKLRRKFFLWNTERKRVAAFKISDGIQSNGLAAYYNYQKYSKSPMYYFDTRVPHDSLISNEELINRLNYLSHSNAIRLAFSGRLIDMKGANDLIKVAILLEANGVDFILDIYGAGDQEDSMKNKIDQKSLGEKVKMRGAVDFNNELLPSIKKSVDLFIMLHKQGDPSCTYLETLACGVPIVGYSNESFSGLMDAKDIGWLIDIDDTNGVASTIERLSNNRKEIHFKSLDALEFSQNHDMESTFINRIQHLKGIDIHI
jgi:glycosyltransferase involved in cell wall biosynthesis